MTGYEDILNADEKFRYMLLSRMKGDCEYYLGYGNRSKRALWAEDEAEQIKVMKALWNRFDDDGKPEWLTWEDIMEYEGEMLNGI